MKHILFAACLLLLTLGGVQHASAQRYLPRQTGIQITGGLVDGFLLRDKYCNFRFHGGIAFSRYNENRTRWVVGVDYLQKDYRYKTINLPKCQITVEGGYFVPFVSNRGKDIFLSAGLSALAGYETTNWGEKALYDGATIRNKDCFIYGFTPAVELEAFLSDRFALLVNVRQRILFGSQAGHFHTLLGVGFKIIID